MKIRFLQYKQAFRFVMFVLLLGVAGMTKVYATYDFSAVCPTGQTLYYTITDTTNHYVALSCPGPENYNNCWSGFTKPTGEIVLPESVEYEGVNYVVITIGNYAFMQCGELTGDLTIPNSVTTIGVNAFRSCGGFTGSLTIGNSVTTIDNYAFVYCGGFTGDLTIPNSVTTIGGHAFSICSFTGRLTIGNSVTSIGGEAFLNCGDFAGVYYMGDIAQWCNISFDGDYANPLYYYHNLYINDSLVTDLVILETVTEIKEFAFYHCTSLTGSLTIPNSVTSIGKSAFAFCSGFTGSLSIGNSVATIGSSAFYGCSGFAGSLAIGNSVTTIGEAAFYGCSGFTGSLTIGNSVTTIEVRAFYGCSGFTGCLTIGNSVTTIGYEAFKGCSGITSAIIPNSVIDIDCTAFLGTGWYSNQPDGVLYLDGCCLGYKGASTGELYLVEDTRLIANKAFYDCSFTGSLTIPSSVTTIGYNAFLNCSGFTGSLTIGTSVTSIDRGAFYGCSGFTSLISLAETPPTLGSDALAISPQFVFVPCGFEEAYTSVQWGGFNNFIEMCGATITTMADPEEGGTVTGDGSYIEGQTCTLTATPSEGYAFLYWLDEADEIVSLDANYTFIVTENKTFTAKFAEEDSICYITFDLYASYGGWWWGNCLVVSFENGSFLQLTVSSGTSASIELPIVDGSHVTLGWIQAFSYIPGSFTVSYSNGNIIYHGENVNDDFSYEFDIDCEEMPATLVDITATLNPDEGGIVFGEGEYEYFTTCTLSATPNQGFLFLNWSRNGELVSCDATYSFTVTGEMDFDAIFMPIEGVFIGEGEETNAYLPSSCEGYALSQQIYTAEEIGTAGYINSVAFYNGGGQQTRTYDIYMVHTDKTTFSDNHDWIAVTENDRVFSGSVTFVPGYWTTIVLDTQFAYDGVSNLAIILDENSGFAPYEPYIACRVFATEDNQAIYVSSDCWGTNFDPTTPSNYNGTLVNEKNQIYLDIHPCARPTGLVCTGTTSSTANLSWIENGTATDWVVQYSTAEDFTDAISINVSATPFVELAGLTTEIYYYAHVKAFVGSEESDWSSTIIFRPTDKVVIGSGNATSQNIPTHFYYRYSLSQQIYTAEEIGTEGLIAGIDFYNIDQGKTRNIDLYMVSTDKASFENANDWITVTENDLVFSGEVTFIIDDWTTIEFTTPFVYDGTSNLAVIVDDNFGYYFFNGMNFLVFDAPSMAICANSDGTNYNPYEPANYTGAILNVKNQIRLDIASSNLGVYAVSVASDHEGYGSVSGGGNYIEGRYCTISATPNYGYGFLNWTDTIGNIISVEPTYTFAVEESASFVAHFVEGAIDLYVSRTGWAMWQGIGNDGPALEGVATIILTAGDVWGDGTGYQMLIDADASAYGTIIPEFGSLSMNCSGNEDLYSQFEYKIPFNADGVCTTENIVFNNSVSTTIPPGTYDWCITNPTPGDRIWIVGNYGSFAPRFDDFEFEAGSTYEFVISMFSGHDGVDLFVNGEARSLRENTGITSEGCRSMPNVATVAYSDRVLPATEKNTRNNLDIVLTLTNRTGDTLYMGTTENNYMQLPTESLQEDEIYILSIAQIYPSGLTNEMASCRWTYQSCNNFEGVSNLYGIINDDGVTLSWEYPEVGGTRVYDEWAFEQGFVTHPGAMVNGADASWKTGSQKGFGVGGVVADDFTCEVLTTINEIEVYAYQAGSSTTSAITGLYIQIYNGNPINDGVVVWGDLETNLMTSTSFTNCYRGSFGNTTDTSRPIMSVTASGLDITLEPGTYYLVYRISRPAGTPQPFFVPYCLPEIGNTGDGLVRIGGVWEYMFDKGTGMPFGLAFHLLGGISVVPSPVNDQVAASIFRDGEWIGFTANDSFIDSDGDIDNEYAIRVVYGGTKQCPYNNAYFTMSCPQVLANDFYEITATANPDEGGTINGTGIYLENSICTLVAAANEGYTFLNWTKDGAIVSNEATYSFEVEGPADYVANFEISLYEITYTVNPEDGGIVTGGGTFVEGQTCTLTATANEGYAFINWSKDESVVSINPTYSFVVTEAGSFVANFSDDFCVLNFDLFDSYGDGWNGNKLVVNYDGVTEELTIGSGSSASYSMTVPEGDHVTLGWISGNWTFECSFTVGYENGFVIYEGSNLNSEFSYEFDVDCSNFPAYEITAAANPETGGTITGAGFYEIGDACTLTATPNPGYAFINWTKDGVVISTSTTYSFTVTGAESYVANFELTGVVQTTGFAQGWNWWSTYIEAEGSNVLGQLMGNLGTDGLTIKSKNQSKIYRNGSWQGALNTITNETSYRVQTSAACEVEISGDATANPTEHPITLTPGWTWIGYPTTETMTASEALANIAPNENDVLKSKNKTAIFRNGAWMNNFTITPGTGLMYKSNSSENVTLVYPTGAKGNAIVEEQDFHWTPNDAAYPSNMTVVATIEMDGIELQGENYELSAFSADDCRGSIQLMEVENRYMAILTVAGDEVTELRFGLYNTLTGEECFSAEPLNYETDAIVGDLDTPYVVRFRSTGIDEWTNDVYVYPNPVERGQTISIGLLTETGRVQVDIINALGVVVEMQCFASPRTIKAPNVSGVYTLRIMGEGKETCYRKLVVR